MTGMGGNVEILIILIGVAAAVFVLAWMLGGGQCPACKKNWALREVSKQQQLGSPDGVYVVLYHCKHCNYQEMKVEDQRRPD
jgi:hypothetical protein